MPKKVPQKTQDLIAKETEGKPQPDEHTVLLIKTVNRNLAGKLVEDGASVKHISGSGQTNDKKYWFIEVNIRSLDKLDSEEAGLIEQATYEEITERINKSIVEKEKDKKESGAQKVKLGEPPVASAHY